MEDLDDKEFNELIKEKRFNEVILILNKILKNLGNIDKNIFKMQELKYISELGENAVNSFNEKIQQGLLPKNAALEVLNNEYSKLESDIEEFKTNLK